MDKKMNNDNTYYVVVMNQGRFRDYLNYLSMGPPSAQN